MNYVKNEEVPLKTTIQKDEYPSELLKTIPARNWIELIRKPQKAEC